GARWLLTFVVPPSCLQAGRTSPRPCDFRGVARHSASSCRRGAKVPPLMPVRRNSAYRHTANARYDAASSPAKAGQWASSHLRLPHGLLPERDSTTPSVLSSARGLPCRLLQIDR